jgi:hypothetical protein
MDEREFNEHCSILGVGSDVTTESLQRSYTQKSYALIRSGAAEADRARLRSAHAALTAHFQAMTTVERHEPPPRVAEVTAPAQTRFATEPPENPYDPRSFDSLWINLLAPPVVAALGILIGGSLFGFFLQGFHIWVHEFGHATVAWLIGRRALPLPLGWTNIGEERSQFVYFGIVFLLAVLFVAGARERKPWPMVFAVLIAIVQYYMTWRLPERQAEMWLAFGGIGGEFYLSAAMMALFYVELPEKFKWGACRYFFVFIGANTFFQSYVLWKKIKRGEEGIPMGSMIHGEDDAGGDMNTLHGEFGWTNREIIRTYNDLADACVIALLVIYLVFAFRLYRWPGLIVARWRHANS